MGAPAARTVVALEPHGFCAGVAGALRKAEALVAEAPRTVYCLHELVHNELVVSALRARGFVFVESVEEVPAGETVLFSAHGVSPAVRAAASRRNLRVVDATCPFVERVHRAARAFAERGLEVAVIGNPGHVEVRGIMGEVESVGGRCCAVRDLAAARALPPHAGVWGVVSQTTMNADEVGAIVGVLRQRGEVETLAEVCRATKVRQDAVRQFAGDALLVLGSSSSSNTRRLCEVARCPSWRAGTLDEVKALDLPASGTLAVTSGASTPEPFFAEALAWLRN